MELKKSSASKKCIFISVIFIVAVFTAFSAINVSRSSDDLFSVVHVNIEGEETSTRRSLLDVKNRSKGTAMPVDVVEDLPVEMALSFSEPPVLSQAVGLSLVVEAEIDVPNAEVRMLLPEGLSLVSGNLQWNGSLSKNGIMKLNVSVKAEMTGNWCVEATAVSRPADGYPRIASTQCYVSVTETEATVWETVLEEMARMEAVELIEKENPESGNSTPRSPGTVTVYGYWYYEDENNNLQPCRHAKVELWDGETLVDEHLATTYVESDGFYEFPAVNNDDGWLEDGLDVYVKVFCDSYQYAIVHVTESTGTSTYWGETDKHDNVADGSHYIGSWKNTGSKRGCWGIYDNIVDEYWWLRNKVGWYRSEVEARWPSGTGPATNGNIIYVPSDWEWHRMMALHEYAHCIHYAARGSSWPPGSGPSPHYIYSESSGGFAITEGWAEFMQCAVDNVGGEDFGTGETIESNSWADYIDSGDWDGNIVEGAVASIFWDIFDGTSSSDEVWGDYVNQEFGRLWTVFLNDDPDDTQTYFWNGWNSRYGVDFDEWSIYHGSRINKDTTAPSLPTSYTSSHTANVWSNDNTIYICFNGASDDLSGVYGYSYVWSHSPTAPDTSVDATSNCFTSPPLSDGDWYCCVRTVDKVDNWSPGYAYNGDPFKIDTASPPKPTISSPSHPNENTWYSNDDPSFSWNTPSDLSGIAGYSYVLDHSSSTTPDTSVDTTGNSKSYSNKASGAWWFHVKAKDNAGNWGTADHYRVRIDTSPPAVPSPDDGVSGWSNDDTPSFTWTSSDSHSGVAGYYWKVDGSSETWTTSTSVTLPPQSDGSHTFYVKAKDNAGNIGDWVCCTIRIDTTPPPPPTVSSPTHPDQDAWYSNNDPTFEWNTPSDLSGIAGYGYTLDNAASTIPDETIDTTGTSVSYTDLADGTWYFHVRPKDNAENWGSPDHYRVQIRAEEEYTVHLRSEETTGATSNLGFIVFGTTNYSLPADPSKSSGSYSAEYSLAFGYQFDHWEAYDGVSVTGGNTSNPTTVSVNGNGTLSAFYTKLTYSITVDPNGGRIYVDGTPITEAKTFEWEYCTTHSLDPDSGYEPSSGTKLIFKAWSDDSTEDPRSVHVDGDITYQAVWKTQYLLTVEASPSGGGTTNSTGTHWYDNCSSVTVKAIPSTCCNFSHWLLDGTDVGSANPYTVHMNIPLNLTAVFSWICERTVMAIEPPETTATPCQSITLNVTVENVTDLYLWTFSLQWDPTVLNLTDIREGDFLKTGGDTTFLVGDINYTGGYATDVTGTLLGPVPGVSGNGTVAIITFHALNCGNSTVHLYDVHLMRSDGTEVVPGTRDGIVQVRPVDLVLTDVQLPYPEPKLYANVSYTVNVTVTNAGSVPVEAFNVSLTGYWQGTVLEYSAEKMVMELGAGENVTLQFSVVVQQKGAYNFTAWADCDDVISEASEVNNKQQIQIDGRIAGDIDGDGDVDYKDLFQLARAYGSEPGDTNWNVHADLNADGKVDYHDLFLLARNYGRADP